MNNLKLRELLGLHRAEFALAERYRSRAERVQALIVLVSSLAILLKNDLLTYAGAIINFLLVIAWQVFDYRAKHSHFVAERGRRAVLLAEGLGIDIGAKSYSDLKMQFSSSESEGKKQEDPKYFKEYGPPGYSKIAYMLDESAFWTQHLYSKCASKYWLMFSVLLLLVIVGLLLITVVKDKNAQIAQILCLLLASLITGDIFNSALRFTVGALAVKDVVNRINASRSSNSLEQELLVIFGDYNAIVQDAPIIPDSIYRKWSKRLNRLWSERQ